MGELEQALREVCRLDRGLEDQALPAFVEFGVALKPRPMLGEEVVDLVVRLQAVLAQFVEKLEVLGREGRREAVLEEGAGFGAKGRFGLAFGVREKGLDGFPAELSHDFLGLGPGAVVDGAILQQGRKRRHGRRVKPGFGRQLIQAALEVAGVERIAVLGFQVEGGLGLLDDLAEKLARGGDRVRDLRGGVTAVARQAQRGQGRPHGLGGRETITDQVVVGAADEVGDGPRVVGDAGVQQPLQRDAEGGLQLG